MGWDGMEGWVRVGREVGSRGGVRVESVEVERRGNCESGAVC